MVRKYNLGVFDEAYLPRNLYSFTGFLIGGGDKYSHQRKDSSGYDLYYNQVPDKSVSGNYSLDIVIDRVDSVIKNHQMRTFTSHEESAGCFEYNVDVVGHDRSNNLKCPKLQRMSKLLHS